MIKIWLDLNKILTFTHKNIMEIREIILKTMKEINKPVKTGELEELTGISKKIITKELKNLQKEDKIIVPKRCYYQAK